MNLLPHITLLLEEIAPFHKIFMENLSGFLWISLAGILLIYVGLKWEWYHKKIPAIIDPLFWYECVYKNCIGYLLPFLLEIELGIIFLYSWLVKYCNQLMELNDWIEKKIFIRYQKTYSNQIKFFVNQNVWENRINKVISYAILPDHSTLSFISSHALGKLDLKIQTIYQEMLQLIRFLFFISNKHEIKSSKYYEDFLDKKGRKIVIVLVVSIVVLTISFVWIYWQFVL
jgi:hypothetical protein